MAAQRRGVYPGTFNPPTAAHVAIAEAARAQRRLDRVDLALSRRPINKEHVEIPTFDHRVEVLQALSRRLGWLGVVVTDATLIVDIALGYDVVIMGADKWDQVNDVRYYADDAARDEAVARLPEIALAPRPHATDRPIPLGMELTVPEQYHQVSSTAARAGRLDWMVPEAQEFDQRTGAWSDPARYRRGNGSSRPGGRAGGPASAG